MTAWWAGVGHPEAMRHVPWLHPAATAYLRELLQPDWTVLEHGSGGSTFWLTERVHWVYSTEDNREWYEYMKERVPLNVTLFFGEEIPKVAPVHLLYIDGKPTQNRMGYMKHARELILPGGIVVLDNSNDKLYYNSKKIYLDEKAISQLTISPNDGGKYRCCDTTFYLFEGGDRTWI